MAIKPVSGEIKSQDINDNLSYLDNKLSQVNGGPLGVLKNENELNQKYPNGANGFFVVLEADDKTGYMYTWDGKKWVKGALYQSMGIADGSITLENIDLKTTDIIASQTQNYDETAISVGYKRYLIFAIEKGGIISTTGNNRDYDASIRSKHFITFDKSQLKILIKDITYRIRFFIYDSYNNFESVTNWIDQTSSINIDSNKKYKIEINRADDLDTVVNEAYSAIKIAFETEKIENFQCLSEKIDTINQDYISQRINFDETPNRFGYNRFLFYEYEPGSISSTNGNDVSSIDSIRTKKTSLITFDNSVMVINLKSDKYRIKFIPHESSGEIIDGGLWVNKPKNGFSLDLTKKYRIQISTMDHSAIDLEDVLRCIKIAYHDDIASGIPDYWKDYLNLRINNIRKLMCQGKNMSAMLLTTDTHFVFGNVNEINDKVAKYIVDKLNVNTMVHLGDLISENINKDIAVDRLNYVISKYSNIVENFFPIRGNHDDNNEGNIYPFSSCITQNESYSWMFRRNNQKTVFGKTGTYYYIDNTFEKTRMIFLDVIDFPYKLGEDYKIKEKHLSWGFDQLNWFANEALITPDDYHIIIFNHTPIVESIVTIEHGFEASKQTLPINSKEMIEILEAYVDRDKRDVVIDLKTVTDFQYFNGTLSVDFTNQKGSIVGWFCGHEHIDDIQPIKKTGIKCVTLLNNSVNFSPSIISSIYQPVRKMFDITEEVYDVLLVNHVEKNVTLFRLGAGNQNIRSFDF